MNINKRLLNFIRLLQNQVEKKAPELVTDQNLLQQSNFLIRSVTWALIATTGCGFGWLALAKTDEIVIVQGKLEPIGNVKDIQIPSGSVIKQILVKSGERVEKDQILIVLDKEISSQNLNSLQAQLLQKNNQFQLKKIEKLKTSELIEGRIKILKDKYLLEQEINNRLQLLLDEGAISELQYLEQSQKAKETLGKIGEEEKNEERQQLLIEQEIETIKSEISTLKAKNTEAKVLLNYKSIRAPVDGLVFDLKPTSTGFAAQSSEPILKIVPFNELEADVLIPSNKIGFVRIGMPAEISIDSFPSSDFGVLKGEVLSIGSDALLLNSKNQTNMYQFPATIKIENQQLLLKDNSVLPLQVGMSLRANLKLRRVSYLQLLLGSFKDKSESLKEI